MKSLISINDFNKEEMLQVLWSALEYEADTNRPLYTGKNYCLHFWTFYPNASEFFETAANRLGARVIGFSSLDATSVTKGESLKDTIKMVSNYSDMIVMRHPLDDCQVRLRNRRMSRNQRRGRSQPASNPDTLICIIRKTGSLRICP